MTRDAIRGRSTTATTGWRKTTGTRCVVTRTTARTSFRRRSATMAAWPSSSRITIGPGLTPRTAVSRSAVVKVTREKAPASIRGNSTSSAVTRIEAATSMCLPFRLRSAGSLQQGMDERAVAMCAGWHPRHTQLPTLTRVGATCEDVAQTQCSFAHALGTAGSDRRQPAIPSSLGKEARVPIA